MRVWRSHALRSLALALFVFVSAAAQAVEIRVSAASSLSDVLRELAVQYQRTTGDAVVFNFGASSMLVRQIEAGAPSDLFVSADELQMNQLVRRKLVRNETRRALLSNVLVVVVPSDSRLMLRNAGDLSGVRRLAVANPSSVPAGIYAKAWLTRAAVWPRLAARIVPVENVRAALAAVEAGNVDCGIVYRTDARISRQVRIAFEAPAADAPAIVYPAAVLRDAKQPLPARRLLDFLSSPAAAAVFRRHGFLVIRQ